MMTIVPPAAMQGSLYRAWEQLNRCDPTPFYYFEGGIAKMSTEPVICPLLSVAKDETQPCVGNRCAWFDLVRCAVVRQNVRPIKIETEEPIRVITSNY